LMNFLLCRSDGIWHTYLAQTQGFEGSTPFSDTILFEKMKKI
jgi:hypothetical protein